MRIFLTLILLLASAIPAFALTYSEVTETCPIDGTEFKDTVPASGTQFGIMLDLMPYGPIGAPWKLPECPRDGFILYKDFTPEEIATLKPYILSDKYQALRRTETQYWRLGQMQEKLGASVDKRAGSFLKATWQANEEQYPRYAQAAILLFQEILRQEGKETEEGFAAALLVGELQRRLGNFDAAKIVFASLQEEAKRKDPIFETIIQQEFQLIKEKNKNSVQARTD